MLASSVQGTVPLCGREKLWWLQEILVQTVSLHYSDFPKCLRQILYHIDLQIANTFSRSIVSIMTEAIVFETALWFFLKACVAVTSTFPCLSYLVAFFSSYKEEFLPASVGWWEMPISPPGVQPVRSNDLNRVCKKSWKHRTPYIICGKSFVLNSSDSVCEYIVRSSMVYSFGKQFS